VELEKQEALCALELEKQEALRILELEKEQLNLVEQKLDEAIILIQTMEESVAAVGKKNKQAKPKKIKKARADQKEKSNINMVEGDDDEEEEEDKDKAKESIGDAISVLPLSVLANVMTTKEKPKPAEEPTMSQQPQLPLAPKVVAIKPHTEQLPIQHSNETKLEITSMSQTLISTKSPLTSPHNTVSPRHEHTLTTGSEVWFILKGHMQQAER